MSAQGAIKDFVEGLIKAAVDKLHTKNHEQDARLDLIEARLDAIESPVLVDDVPVKRGPGRPRKDAAVQAGTAEVSAKASNT